MSTITEFLLARVAEDEAQAGAFVSHPRRTGGTLRAAREKVRVLAECAAKRAIIEPHEPACNPFGWDDLRCNACTNHDDGDFDGSPMIDWPCPTLRHLAAVYADHPDYREEWRP